MTDIDSLLSEREKTTWGSSQSMLRLHKSWRRLSISSRTSLP